MLILLISFYQVQSSDYNGITIDINTDSIEGITSTMSTREDMYIPIGVPQSGNVEMKILTGRVPPDAIGLQGPYTFRKHRIYLIVLRKTVRNNGLVRIRISFQKKPIEVKGGVDKLFSRVVLNGSLSNSWLTIERKSSIPWEPYGIKIMIKKEGIYRISSSYLSSLGIVFNPLIDSLALSYKGNPVPIYVEDVNQDGIFNSNDYFIFYAFPVKSDFDTLSCYWLRKGQGAQYIELSPLVTARDTQNVYRDSIYINIDSLFSRNAGTYLYKLDTLFSFTFDDSLFAYGNPCSLKIRVFNPANSFDTVNIYVNDSLAFYQLIPGSNFTSINLGLNLETPSLIKIKTHSFVYLDYFLLSYDKKMISNRDYFVFKARERGVRAFTIRNYPNPDPVVLRVDGYKIIPNAQEEGPLYTISFADTIIQPSQYVVYTPGTEKKPYRIVEIDERDVFQNIPNSDMIIITSSAFQEVAEEYKSFHEEKGVSVSVFTTEAIYDAFGYGEKSPYAIKDFLKYIFDVTNPPPTYLFLLGKGTYDSKNISGAGSDIVPVILHRTPEGYFASDYIYSFVDDDYPDLIVGRLPCVTPGEAEAYLNKMMYGRSSDEPFENTLFFGADYALSGAGTESDRLINSIVPSSYNIVRVYSREGTSVWEEVIDAVNNGVSIFNFHGHGSEEDLGAGRYFRVYDIPRLNNYSKLCFMLAFTCANGVMDVPDFRSVGELSVVFPGVGMIGSIGPSGFTYFDENLLSDSYYLNALLKKGITTMGDVLYSYNFTHPKSYNSYVYLLIGDPAFKLDIPVDSLNVSAWQHADSITVKVNSPASGRCFFTLFDSTNVKKFSLSVSGGVAETTFNYIPLSSSSYITAFLKSDSLLINGESPVYSRDVFSSSMINPPSPLIGDTIEVIFTTKFIPDSAKLRWRYGNNGASEDHFNISHDTLRAYLPIEEEKTNLLLQAIVYDSANVYYSRWYGVYIKERPNLRFSDSPTIFTTDTLVFLKTTIVNSGETKSDSTGFVVFQYLGNVPATIYSNGLSVLNPGETKTLFIPLTDSLISQIDTFLLRIDLDPSNNVNESSESDNTTYFSSLKGVFYVDENTDTVFGYKSLTLQIRSGDFSKKSIILIEDADFPAAFSQEVSPVKVDGNIISYKILFSNLLSSFKISCVPDTSGKFYIFRDNKWVMLTGIDSGDTITAEIPDTGIITVLANEDTIPPLLMAGSDTASLFSTNQVQMSFRMEDEEGIDQWLHPPVAIVDGDTSPLKLSKSRHEDIFTSVFKSVLEEGTHHIVVSVQDVNGNKTTYEKTFDVSIPFEIVKVSNYPNPAISHTSFGFILSKPADRVILEIFQPDGKMVRRMEMENPSIFPAFIDWDLLDSYGRKVANGVYGYRLTAEKGIYIVSKTGKMAVLKR